jgi:hypothetical protein
MGADPTPHELAEQLLAEVGYDVGELPAAVDPAREQEEIADEHDRDVAGDGSDSSEPELAAHGGWSMAALRDMAGPAATIPFRRSPAAAVRQVLSHPVAWASFGALLVFFAFVAPITHDRQSSPQQRAVAPSTLSITEPAQGTARTVGAAVGSVGARPRKPPVQRPHPRTGRAHGIVEEPARPSESLARSLASPATASVTAPAARPVFRERPGWSGEFSP